MNTRERRNGRRRRHMLHNYDSAASNPMESLSGFSDVMLVLAVGILLALVLRWNVPISQQEGESREEESASGIVSLEQSALQKVELIPAGASQVGTVYYDAQTGNYYILQE